MRHVVLRGPSRYCNAMQSKSRTTYESFSVPYGKVCLKLGLTPNILTTVGLLLAGAAAIAIWREYFITGMVLVVLASVADMLDGATARAGDLGTKFGSVFDHTVDRVGEFLIMLGIILCGHVHPGWVLFGLFGMWSASYTRAAAESVGGMKSCEAGLVGRLEKFGILIIGLVLERFFPGYALSTAVIAVGVISLITAGQRLRYAYVQLIKPPCHEGDEK